MPNKNILKKQGFTLLELLMAAALGAIVVFSGTLFLASSWRVHNRFLNQQITMDEITLLSALFQKETKTKSSTSNSITQDFVVFDDGSGNTTSFVYNPTNSSIVFTDESGAEQELLEESIISGFSIIPDPTHNWLEMRLTIVETEL